MDLLKAYKKVEEFQNEFEFSRLAFNDVNVKFRDELLTSELNELRKGIKESDDVEIVDGICDMIYVIMGSVHSFSMRIVDDKIIATKEVHTMISKAEEYNNAISFCFDIAKTLGFYENLDKFFDLVHKSNMSKACKTIDEVHATMAKYSPMETMYVEKNGSFLVKSKAPFGDVPANKLLKSVNYRDAKPELKKELESWRKKQKVKEN